MKKTPFFIRLIFQFTSMLLLLYVVVVFVLGKL